MHVAEQLLCLMIFSFDVHLLSSLNRGFITESRLLLKRLYSTWCNLILLFPMCFLQDGLLELEDIFFDIKFHYLSDDRGQIERWVLASPNDDHWRYYCEDVMCGWDVLICVYLCQLACWSWPFESVLFFSSNFIVPHLCSSNFEVFASWRSGSYILLLRARMLLLCFAFNIKCYMGHLRDFNLNLIFRCYLQKDILGNGNDD